MPRLIRITTVPVSMQVLLRGQLKFMKEHGFDVTMVSADGEEVKALEEQEGSPHIAVPFTRMITPIKDMICWIKMFRIFRKLKPDIVHSHTSKAGLIGMSAAWFAGVPVRLHTIAGIPWIESKGFFRYFMRLLEKVTVMFASKIYPNSFNQEKFLEAENIAVGKMKVLGKGSSNGIDTDFFSVTPSITTAATKLREEKKIETNAWVWIFVGRLVKDKGIGELLDAFQKIQEKFPADRLWLLGEEEPELDPLDEHHASLLHTHPAIYSWGFQKDIRPYLAASQVLVFPSYREGFPNVPMQAGLMGCMLLLSDINGCNEIVQDKENGLLVPSKNTEALTASMFLIRQDPELRTTYAQAIQSRIKKEYEQQHVWDLILEEYHYWLTKKGIAF
ncbi:MAG: glycosyltransferase family 4 protein [Ferruginibacter sp.]